MKRLLLTIMLFGLAIVNAEEQPAYLKIGGIQGDSQTPEHKAWFELASFDQGPYRWTKKGGTRNYLPHDSGSEGSGKLTVTRFARMPSTDVYYAATKGTYFGNVMIDVPIHTGMGKRYIRWNLSDVIVTGINVERAHGKRGLPIEQITISYQRAEWELPDRNTAQSDGRPSTSWHKRS